MKNSLAVVLVAPSVVATSRLSSADTFCAISRAGTSGDPDCGFDGELCPRGRFNQLP